MSRIKVTINKKGNIPHLGAGPIRRPILISEELCDQLIKLGYPVKIINAPLKKAAVVKKETPVASVDVVVIPETSSIKNETVEEVVVEPAVDEIIETVEDIIEEEENIEEENIEEVEEEVVINDPDLVAESYYTEDFLASKNICKKILASREVQYDSNATWALLKQLVMDSNPEVEISE